MFIVNYLVEGYLKENGDQCSSLIILSKVTWRKSVMNVHRELSCKSYLEENDTEYPSSIIL